MRYLFAEERIGMAQSGIAEPIFCAYHSSLPYSGPAPFAAAGVTAGAAATTPLLSGGGGIVELLREIAAVPSGANGMAWLPSGAAGIIWSFGVDIYFPAIGTQFWPFQPYLPLALTCENCPGACDDVTGAAFGVGTI